MKVLCFGSLNIDYTYKVPHFVKKGETLASERLQVFGGRSWMIPKTATKPNDLRRKGGDSYVQPPA